jgi:hypothetical protein
MRRSLSSLAVLAVVAAGCGHGSTGTVSSTVSAHQKALKFAECMRSHGVSAFPDPGPSGSYTMDGVVNGSTLDPNSPAFGRAVAACRSLEPAGFTGTKATPRQTVVRLEFARCIRAHGVSDFPDPTPDGPLVDTNRIPSAATPAGMSALNAAMHTCGEIYAGELGLKGR